MPKFKNLTGMKFGRLTAIGLAGKNRRGKYCWFCQCNCGNITEVASGDLTSGHTRSCGCLQKEIMSKTGQKNGANNSRKSILKRRLSMIKHGDSPRSGRSSLYETWQNIKARCLYPNNIRFKHYGGRGISVCPEWKDNYLAFKIWALANGYQEGLTIDRIDNDGNYEPENCQFLTRSENSRKECQERKKCQKS